MQGADYGSDQDEHITEHERAEAASGAEKVHSPTASVATI
jgi:hypothetical protein